MNSDGIVDKIQQNKVFCTLGASNHTDKERQIDDYYATDPKAVEMLIEFGLLDKETEIWECACGEGHISKILKQHGYKVKSTDLINRGYGDEFIDFLKSNNIYNGNIVTNPPYKYAKEFAEHALNIVSDGNKVIMLLKIQFLEGKARKELFKKYPPKYIYVSSSRLQCAKNGDFVAQKDKTSAMAYAWYVWEKGFTGEPIIRWFN